MLPLKMFISPTTSSVIFLLHPLFFIVIIRTWVLPSMVDGMLERIEESIGQSVTTVATGGNAPRILRYCKRPIQYDADLIMTGLYLLYQKNAKKYRKA